MFGIFKIFRRKKEKASPVHNAWQKLAQVVEKRQRKWSVYLGQKITSWPLLYVRITFVSFCILYGGCSVYLLFTAFWKQPATMKVDKISIPSHVIQPDTKELNQQLPIISESEYQRIKSFMAYMDSLKHDQRGRFVYDSIVQERPGLLDSVSVAESIYKQQKK